MTWEPSVTWHRASRDREGVVLAVRPPGPLPHGRGSLGMARHSRTGTPYPAVRILPSQCFTTSASRGYIVVSRRTAHRGIPPVASTYRAIVTASAAALCAALAWSLPTRAEPATRPATLPGAPATQRGAAAAEAEK